MPWELAIAALTLAFAAGGWVHLARSTDRRLTELHKRIHDLINRDLARLEAKFGEEVDRLEAKLSREADERREDDERRFDETRQRFHSLGVELNAIKLEVAVLKQALGG